MKQKAAVAIFVLVFLGLIFLLHVNGQSSNGYGITQLASLEDKNQRDLYSNKVEASIPTKGESISDSIFELCKPAPLNGISEQIIKKKAYIVSYNKDTKIPNWVAWHLTNSHTDGDIKRTNIFYEDDIVPIPRATLEDYKGSGWSRGHMCPAGDNKWDIEAMNESFSLINVCPQNASLNSGLWNSIEIDCRNWANRFHDIYIVCGPVFYRQEHVIIGRNEVYVPEAFFKVVLCLYGIPKGLGIVVKNNAGEKKKDLYYNSIDQIERITGFDFFPALPDEIENEIEANLDLDKWK